MRRILLCTLALTLTAPVFAQEKPILSADLGRVELPPPPPPLKVALAGKALSNYEHARSTALRYLESPVCFSFLKAHSFDPPAIAHALSTQQPQDGAASQVTMWEVGVAHHSDPAGARTISVAFHDPKFLTMAVSQPGGTDSYYNPDFFEHKERYPYSLPVSVIHEAIHNLTGENDIAIAQDMGYDGFEAVEADIYVNDSLKKYCDSTH